VTSIIAPIPLHFQGLKGYDASNQNSNDIITPIFWIISSNRACTVFVAKHRRLTLSYPFPKCTRWTIIWGNFWSHPNVKGKSG